MAEFSYRDVAQWVDKYGDELYGYALARLRDRNRAEDAVQETFLAALTGIEGFSRREAGRNHVRP